MSSTLCKSSLFLQDKQLCESCNKYMQRICPKMGCKMCFFIKSIYNLDYQYTQKVLAELNQWRTCPKHLSPYQYYNKDTKCMWCAECTLEVIQDEKINLEQKFKKFEKFDLVDKLTEVDQQKIQKAFSYNSLNIIELFQHLENTSKKIDLNQPELMQNGEEDQSLQEYKKLVDDYCEQSNIIRFQSFYGHCQQNKISCIKTGFIPQSRQKMYDNFQEQDFNKLIDKIKQK
ncbi:hypothetical protein pb186bvf_007591 [Paramecium bursaria]